jgi:hypothetical protein
MSDMTASLVLMGMVLMTLGKAHSRSIRRTWKHKKDELGIRNEQQFDRWPHGSSCDSFLIAKPLLTSNSIAAAIPITYPCVYFFTLELR